MPSVSKKNEKVAAKKKTTKPARADKPNHEMVAERAYWLWRERGHAHGHDLADWLEAETQLKNELIKHSRMTVSKTEGPRSS